jgi:hypothetical protein
MPREREEDHSLVSGFDSFSARGVAGLAFSVDGN